MNRSFYRNITYKGSIFQQAMLDCQWLVFFWGEASPPASPPALSSTSWQAAARKMASECRRVRMGFGFVGWVVYLPLFVDHWDDYLDEYSQYLGWLLPIGMIVPSIWNKNCSKATTRHGLRCCFTLEMQNSNSDNATSLISEAMPLRALVVGVINLSQNSAQIIHAFIQVGSHKPRCILDTPRPWGSSVEIIEFLYFSVWRS